MFESFDLLSNERILISNKVLGTIVQYELVVPIVLELVLGPDRSILLIYFIFNFLLVQILLFYVFQVYVEYFIPFSYKIAIHFYYIDIIINRVYFCYFLVYDTYNCLGVGIQVFLFNITGTVCMSLFLEFERVRNNNLILRFSLVFF